MRTIRVAVWGLGPHALANILPAVARTDGLELYGVCSRSSAVVVDCARTWACRGWTESGAMLQDAAVDAVYLATPIGLHAIQGRQVVSAGKHLWCEKPLTCFLHDTLALVETARAHRVSLCEGLMYLYHPQFERLSGYLSDGTLGAVRSIACRFGIPKLERPGFRDDAALGGGALLDVGCYPVSAIHGLFPEEEVRVVHASVRTPQGGSVDTDGDAIVVLPGAARAYLEWRTGCAYRNEIDLWGEHGSVSTERIFSKAADYVPHFQTRDVRGAVATEAGMPGNHFINMLRFFTSTIDDPVAAEVERCRIIRRAQTMDRIRALACAGEPH